jgi:hypothetical protein
MNDISPLQVSEYIADQVALLIIAYLFESYKAIRPALQAFPVKNSSNSHKDALFLRKSSILQA